MLRCPKCSRIYQDGTQRFCTHDGGRLLPVAQASQSSSPFENPADNIPNPAFPERREPPSNLTGLEQTLPSWKPKSELVPNLPNPSTPVPNYPVSNQFPRDNASASVGSQPAPYNDVKSGNVAANEILGHPSGRLVYTRLNPETLIGQTVKGRYLIEQLLWQEQNFANFQAQDRLTPGKRVTIKVLLDDPAGDKSFTKKFYEERITFSHINHPSIASVLDAGDLPEGKPYMVMEFIEGKPLRAAMREIGQFSAVRAGRIARQVGYALSEVNNYKILHGNLKPEKIILRLLENGAEQARVIDFASQPAAGGLENIAYQSPEQLSNQPISHESDVFSLGVISYEMITGRLPYHFSSTQELLESQRRGIAVKPTNLRLDLSPSVDAVLMKALSYDPRNRYHHAREFGESLFVALTEPVDQRLPSYPETGTEFSPAIHRSYNPNENQYPAEVVSYPTVPAPPTPTNVPPTPVYQSDELNYAEQPTNHQPVASNVAEQPSTSVRPAEPNVWEKRRPAQKPVKMSLPLILALAFGALLLVGALVGVGFWLLNRSEEPQVTKQETPLTTTTTTQPENNSSTNNTNDQTSNTNSETIEKTAVKPPPDFVLFQNKKEGLTGKLSENHTYFSIYYPPNWKKYSSGTGNNFLDIANKDAGGLPIEQLLISWYKSKGSFDLDRPDFPKAAKDQSAIFAKEIPNYRLVSEQEFKLNGRDAYEFRFEGSTKDASNKEIKIYGRTVFVPSGENGKQSGLKLTMLATSLSPEINSAADVGEKGDLKQILETFQPETGNRL